MKSLKGADLEKRLNTLEEVEKLYSELKACLAHGEPAMDKVLEQRSVCDRILRSCNQRVGERKCCPAHFQSLLALAELACQGYVAGRIPRTPLYLEKILFHFLKNIATLGAYDGCAQFADLLYNLLVSSILSTEHERDYIAIAKSCFSVLWKGAEGLAKSEQWTLSESKAALCSRLRAVRFVLLLEGRSLVPLPGEVSSCASLASRHASVGATMFESQISPVTKDDVRFLSDQIFSLLIKPLIDETHSAPLTVPQVSCLLGLTLERCRRLCKNDCFEEAKEAVKEVQVHLLQFSSGAAVELCRLGVELQQSHTVGVLLEQASGVLRQFTGAQGARLMQAQSECSQLVVSAVERRVKKTAGNGLALHDILSLSSFLQLHCNLLHTQVLHVPPDTPKQQRSLKLQLFSCLQLYTNVVCDRCPTSQVEKPADMGELLKTLLDTVARMLEELGGLPEQDQQEFLGLTASCVFNLAHGLYSQNMYAESSDVLGIFCEKLGAAALSGDPHLPVDRLHKCFRLQVESCRKAGLFERGFRSVALWLAALRGQIAEQLEDPIYFWVRIKMDAVKSGLEDLRLKTLKDCLADSSVAPLEPATLLLLLSEELKAYKAVHADTGQERYNVICDLLEVCSEDSGLLHERAVYLVELAQVLCYHDYTEQTDCSALDSVQEALRVLDAVPSTPANAEQLTDDKAHARLWLYICTIESKMQESLERELRGGRTDAQFQRNIGEFEPNDLNYEDKLQEEKFAHDGINFNLMADSVQSNCLDEALSLWKKLLSTKHVPKVRSTEQTVTSLNILAALYRLLGKPLQSIDCDLLVWRLSDALGDNLAVVNALCHLAKILFLLRCPSYAEIYLKEAKSYLSKADCSGETHLRLKLTCELLQSQLCYVTDQVKEGVALLLGLFNHPSLQKSSKAWYLLRAHILQLLASYLSLPSSSLSSELRQQLCEQGWRTAETALSEAHKLLRSIVFLLLGNAVFTPKMTADHQFVNHGDNLLQKWQVLGDLLSCSQELVSLLSRVGSVSEAKAFCLESLKLSVKLQAVRQCAEFLVTKAELELQRTESELCQQDLQEVLFLLESGTVFKTKAKLKEVKIPLKKGKTLGKKTVAGHPTLPEEEGFLKGPHLEFVDIATVDKQSALTASPVLKPKLKKRPAFLSHTEKCTCCVCSDIALSAVCIRWVMTFAEMQVASGSPSKGSSLLRVGLLRCNTFTSRFSNVLRNALSREQNDSKQNLIEDLLAMRLVDCWVAQIYSSMASLSSAANPLQGMDEYVHAGLSFITSTGGHSLEHSKADLLLTKALNSLHNLASKNGGSVSDIFSPVWAWNPPPPLSATTKGSARTSETKTGRTGAPPAVKGKSTLGSSSQKRIGSTVKQRPIPQRPDIEDVFSLNFSDSEVPTIILTSGSGLTTPVQKSFPRAQAKSGIVPTSMQLKKSFTVFNEQSPPEDKHLVKAPKASRKVQSRLKVAFSDDSDSDVPDEDLTAKSEPGFPVDGRKEQPTCGRARASGRKTRAENRKQTEIQSSTECCPRRGRPTSKEPDVCSTVEKEKSGKPTRRATRGQAHCLQDEVEMLRVIHEDEDAFEISFEILRGSDCEEDKPAKGRRKRPTAVQDGGDGECEVLRRDAASDLGNWLPGAEQQEADLNPFSMEGLSASLQSAISVSDFDAIYDSLKDAFFCVCHYPPSALYAQLCQLMALCLGSRDPYTTAFLVSESVAVTTRHQLISNIHKKLRKKKKEGPLDVSDQLQDLVLLDERNGDLAEHLTQLENLFQFSCSGLDVDHFREQLQQIPNDVVVCLLTLVDPYPGAMGDTLLLTRLERACTPITVRIPTAQAPVSLSSALREFDAIQKEQKEISNRTDKKEWWEGRSSLDQRMKLLIESLEYHVLGCWKGLLLPSCSNPGVAEEAHSLAKSLGECGLQSMDAEGLLKAVLNGSCILTPQHVRSLAFGLCQAQPYRAHTLLQTAVEKLKRLTGKSSGNLVLVLDKNLQKLPWESLPCLISRPATRLPSLRFLLSYNFTKKYCPRAAFTRGVDPSSTYYVLNPQANLPGTEERFRDWFQSESKWSGVTGKVPSPEQVQAALIEHDLYIYAGHGAGAHFLDWQSLIRLDCNAVSLLFGCSSAALSVRGKLEGAGIILKFLMAGCPLVMGNLWDVTDRDIDRYMEALLQSWMKAGSGASILPYIAQSRQAPKLKYLIGAAPIAYGMPVTLR